MTASVKHDDLNRLTLNVSLVGTCDTRGTVAHVARVIFRENRVAFALMGRLGRLRGNWGNGAFEAHDALEAHEALEAHGAHGYVSYLGYFGEAIQSAL